MKRILLIFAVAALSSCATPKQQTFTQDLPAEFTLKCGDCRDLH